MCVAGYLMGSISSAILVCRLFGYPDPRTEGSNNPGATNVLRIGGKPAAALTLLGDVMKGVIPVLVANYLNLGPLIAALVGTSAFLGHLYPVFFRFEGGKGVATAFGLLFALHWPSGLVAGGTWLSVFALNRISSIASLSAFVVAPACIFAWLSPAFWPILVMSLVMIARHRSNLQKILRGEELGFKKKDQ
ncbi:glycerol-3-phosphate 1-O-acyltransferase PlsY [Alcanivorax sp. PA15-N-34]|uniref:Glycerol-3-phosphate acyltransferase n=1 Tax=Alcanivorax sediminis TaxID=2663008 RepID=A0A6N7LUH3_9GAMM|nr:glycerol-3-phosphate 1-O-acyltransferase PlsY [Alcanivorax sediminis]